MTGSLLDAPSASFGREHLFEPIAKNELSDASPRGSTLVDVSVDSTVFFDDPLIESENWRPILEYANGSASRLLFPDIVLDEAVNKCREKLRAAENEIRSADGMIRKVHSSISKPRKPNLTRFARSWFGSDLAPTKRGVRKMLVDLEPVSPAFSTDNHFEIDVRKLVVFRILPVKCDQLLWGDCD